MKKQIIIGLSLLICIVLQAQEKRKYLSFTAGGGLHGLSYDLQNGIQKGQPGYSLNVGYSYFFSPNWGLQSGIGLQSFQAKSTLDYLLNTSAVDSDGSSYTFRVNYKSWQEKQQALFFEIPLVLQYRHSIGKKFGLLGSAGGKISIPVHTSFKTTGGEIVTTGYYSQWNFELSDMPHHGFSTISNNQKGDLSLKPVYMAVADVGGLYALSDKIDLYVGAYVNFGLNNALKADTKEIYQVDGVYNGVLASTQTNKVNTLSFGLKVGLYLRLGKTKQIIKVDELALVKQTPEPVQKVESDSVKTTKVDTVKVPDSVAVIASQRIEIAQPVSVAQPATSDDSVSGEDSLEKARKIAASLNLKFGFGSDQPANAHAEDDKIKALSDILKVNPDIALRIVGHTCNIGSHEINLREGMKRALVIKQKTQRQGVSSSQLLVESKAYDQPLVPNTSQTNRAKNRRVEIKIFRIIKK